MLTKALALFVLAGICFGFQNQCGAIPKQLRLVKEKVNLEIETLANRIELEGCSAPDYGDGNFRSGGWELIFRATAGNGVDTYEAWQNGKLVTTHKPNNMRRSCGVPYRNPKVNRWSELEITKIKFSFFEHGKEVAFAIFDGEGSDQHNWFSKDRLEASSWCDLSSNHDFNHFSIFGHEEHKRRFFINFNYGGCDNDRGHTVIIDKDAASRPCLFDHQPDYPQFLYSKISTADHWNRRMFGRADHIAIFIQRSGQKKELGK